MEPLERYQGLIDKVQKTLVIIYQIIVLIWPKIKILVKSAWKIFVQKLKKRLGRGKLNQRKDQPEHTKTYYKLVEKKKVEEVRPYKFSVGLKSHPETIEVENWDEETLSRIPTGKKIRIKQRKLTPYEQKRQRWGGLSLELMQNKEFMEALDKVEQLEDPYPLQGAYLCGEEIEQIISRYAKDMNIDPEIVTDLVQDLIDKTQLKAVAKLTEMLIAQTQRYRDLLVTFARMHQTCAQDTKAIMGLYHERVNEQLLDPEIRHCLDQNRTIINIQENNELKHEELERRHAMLSERVNDVAENLAELSKFVLGPYEDMDSTYEGMEDVAMGVDEETLEELDIDEELITPFQEIEI